MDFNTLASTSFKTSVANDTAKEVESECNLHKPNSLYIKATKTTDLPHFQSLYKNFS